MRRWVLMFSFMFGVASTAAFGGNTSISQTKLSEKGAMGFVLSWSDVEGELPVDFELLDNENIALDTSACPDVVFETGECLIRVSLDNADFYGWQQNALFVEIGDLVPLVEHFAIKGSIAHPKEAVSNGFNFGSNVSSQEWDFAFEQVERSLSALDVSIRALPMREEPEGVLLPFEIAFLNEGQEDTPLVDGQIFVQHDGLSGDVVVYEGSDCLTKILAPQSLCTHKVGVLTKREKKMNVSFYWRPLLPSDEYGVRIILERFELDENGMIVKESTSGAYGPNRWAIPLGSVSLE